MGLLQDRHRNLFDLVVMVFPVDYFVLTLSSQKLEFFVKLVESFLNVDVPILNIRLKLGRSVALSRN